MFSLHMNIFMEMYDYTNFYLVGNQIICTKSYFVQCQNDTAVSRDSTIVKQLPARVPAKQKCFMSIVPTTFVRLFYQ